MTSKRRPHAPIVELAVDPEVATIAIQRDSGHCMWADAVARAVPDATKIAVDLQTIRFTDPAKGLRYTYLTPRTAQISLLRFDDGQYPTERMSVTLRRGQVTKAGNYTRVRRRSGVPPMPDGTKREMHKQQQADVPAVVGGKTPPTGPLTNTQYRGKRRLFGLRGLSL